jgi:hypothetical protein
MLSPRRKVTEVTDRIKTEVSKAGEAVQAAIGIAVLALVVAVVALVIGVRHVPAA